jgi:hypothetical protein
LLLALSLATGVGHVPTALAQVCTPTTPDDTPCDDDLDPCTDDRCDDGECEHTRVGFPEACAPILSPFQRVLVLAPFVTRLTSQVAALPVGVPPAFTGSQRGAMVEDLTETSAQLEQLRRTLGGLEEAPGDTAQGRAKAAFTSVTDGLLVATNFRDLVRAAARAGQFEPSLRAELERSAADLVRGLKDVKRDLNRLRRVSQVFRP